MGSRELALERTMAITPTVPKRGQHYRHYKTGGVYEIVGTARNKPNFEPVVIYKGVQEPCLDGWWVRTILDFVSVVWSEEKRGYVERFELCAEVDEGEDIF